MLLVLGLSVANADIFRTGSITAEARSTGVHLQWVSDDESGVAYYTVERSTDNSDAYVALLMHVSTKGNGSIYAFDDDTAFMTTNTVYKYRISAVDASGRILASYPAVVVKSSSTSVRRTWGSIKAMFR